MTVTVGPREKAILCQTLAPILVGLVGYTNKVAIDLKHELQICGIIQSVDCFLNVTMTSATISSPHGRISEFDFIFIQRRSIRSVVLPENLPAWRLLKNQVDIVTGVKAREERKKAKERRANYLRKKEMKRMAEVESN